MAIPMRYVIILFGVLLLLFTLYIGSTIIIPIYTALLFSLLMLPFSNMLERRGVSRSAGALLSILVVFLILCLLGFFLSSQVQKLTEDSDRIQERVSEYYEDARDYLQDSFGLERDAQKQYAEQAKEQSGTLILGLGSIVSSLFIASILLPMSMYFFMAHRHHYKKFFFKLYDDDEHEELQTIFQKEKKIVLKYLTGIFSVVLILAVCNTIALTLFGQEHALLFGVLAALLNIIPVVGTIVGSLIPILYAVIMEDSIMVPIGIALYFWGIQILESSLITPNVVGNRVRVNPLAILVAIFIGGQLWGAAGMVLFIPMVAQVKSLCNVVPNLKPFGHLLTDPAADKESRITRWFTRLKQKIRPAK
jgi:predicted PurR-regulated permease PerM